MRILCFGDSNTYGYDPRSCFGDRYPSQDRWTDILARQTGWEVINAGANGREIPLHSDGCRFFSEYGAADLLLVMLGTNDLLQGASATEAAGRMETFLCKLLTSYTNILLIAPPPMKRGAWVPTDHLAAESIRLAQAYQLLARKWHILFADPHDWGIELAFDGVHFTESGHHAFGKQLVAFLKAHTIAEPQISDFHL